VIELVRQYVRQLRLLQPGDRVAVAVSGGADSVALLRALKELKQDLGIVLSVAHFHHGIRGAEADADREFVRALADRLGLELHLGAADAPAHARSQRISLETAARDLRHAWFARLIADKKADKIATAHTLDDQAETVLMRLVRGTGIRGLAGIFPVQQEKRLIRPLLAVTRREVESYLKTLGQDWREDSSNQDLSHTRNRVRHQLLPLLEQDFSPGIRKTLADLAEIARAESEYWDRETAALLPRIIRPGKPSRSGRNTSREASRTLSLDLAALTSLPLALERQLLHRVAGQLGSRLEFVHVQQLSELAREKRTGKRVILPGGLVAQRSFRELQFTTPDKDRDHHDEDERSTAGYEYPLRVPGETPVPELGSIIHVRLIHLGREQSSTYNSGSLLNPARLAAQLIVRNWRAGDRFFPARTRAPKKLKELLQPDRLGRDVLPHERKSWPVVESAGEIVWVRGFSVPESFAAAGGSAVLIEERQSDVRDVVGENWIRQKE
jgi:tRNA(Ile)-lysidine synthase